MILRSFSYLFLVLSLLPLGAMFIYIELIPILLAAGLGSILTSVLLNAAQDGLDLLRDIRDEIRISNVGKQ